MIELVHAFFNFLGQTPGALFKTVIELVLFLFVDYMIISEWTRYKRRELAFLVIAFSVMALQKFLTVFFLARSVFIGLPSEFHLLTFVDNLLEVFSLFLVTNAFAYPILKQRRIKTVSFMKRRFILCTGISFILSVFVLSIIDLSGGRIETFWTIASINVTEVVVLLYYAAYIMVNTEQKVRYRGNIVAAFIIFAITPTIELFNMILYDGMNQSLVVASQPFPFLSILLITQVIYLKLVDKAMIIHKLRESKRQYQQEKKLSKLKDEFISTVSHELRTPLTSMKLYVNFLKQKKLGKTTKKQDDALKIIDEETNRLNKLIADILDLSRFEAQKMKLDLTTFDLYEIVSNKMYLDMAKERKINVLIQVPHKFTIQADRDKITQVFINLYNNALKFTPPGGSITVSSGFYPSEWEFCLSDTGKGVPKKILPKLFNKFYQAENFMTRDQGGMGLGLAIVKSIVDLHKGKITAESEVGKGTKISMRIPRELMY